jgi:hypothetical protein
MGSGPEDVFFYCYYYIVVENKDRRRKSMGQNVLKRIANLAENNDFIKKEGGGRVEQLMGKYG